jgi:sulfite reductase alpha subunit-like flavoprotein
VSLTVGVLEYVTSFGRLRRGVASSYLSRRAGDREVVQPEGAVDRFGVDALFSTMTNVKL